MWSIMLMKQQTTECNKNNKQQNSTNKRMHQQEQQVVTECTNYNNLRGKGQNGLPRKILLQTLYF